MDATFGQTLRRIRTDRGLSLAQLGKRVSYTRGYIWELEQDKKTPAAELVKALDDALDAAGALATTASRPASPAWRSVASDPIREGGGWVDRRQMLAASLAALGVPLVSSQPDGLASVARLADRLLGYPRPEALKAPSLATVRKQLAVAGKRYDEADFTTLAGMLPSAIDDAETYAALAAQGDDGPAATALLARTYAATASTAIMLGRLDLAWIAADRATMAAGRSGDALAEATAARQVAILCRKAGRPQDAVRVAVKAADQLHARGLTTADHVSAYGLLMLSAGYAEAVGGDRSRSSDLYTAGANVAHRLGDDTWHDGFGVTNVAVHEIGAKYVLGDAGTAVDIARTIRPGQLPTPERAQRYWVDVARAFRRWNKPIDAFKCMLAAERAAPKGIRVRPAVHSMAAWLLSTPSTVSMAGVRDFAVRVGAA